MTIKKRIGVLISGSGSNMEQLAKACMAADYPAEIMLVISDKRDAKGLDRAKNMGIQSMAIARSDYASKAEHEAAILMALDQAKLDFVCLAGFMRILSGQFIEQWARKLINIHPSLLPLFPGLDTHKRAIDAGCRVHGCSVHFVTEGMDEGPIISQAVVPIAPNDTIETLSTRILKVEHQLYPRALAMIANGQVYMGEDGHSHFNDVTMTDMDQQLIS